MNERIEQIDLSVFKEAISSHSNQLIIDDTVEYSSSIA